MVKDFSFQQKESVLKFIENCFQPQDAVLSRVRARAKAEGLPDIHVGEMDGLHLEVLARACAARKIVEIGTLAGYSGIFLLRGGGPTCHLYTFDISDHHAEVAKASFEDAGLSNQVTQYVGAARERLVEIETSGPFDLVFVDADKASYPIYFKWAERNLRKGGLLIGDNTFAFGMLGDDAHHASKKPHETDLLLGLQEFNMLMGRSGSFKSTILPTGAGLTVGVKL